MNTETNDNLPRKKPILCLDFDGVIHSYTSGWKGADVIPDPPVPGALEFIVNAWADFEIHIYSSRSHQKGGIDAMRAWLRKELIAAEVPELVMMCFDANRLVEFPKHKPSAFVTIDDRAIRFTGEWPTVRELLAFKPWNK